MTNEEIQAIFFVECDEALAAAEAALDRCRQGDADDETVNAIFRAVHSIKGGAGAFGFEALQAYTHGFETLLSDVRDGTVAVNDPLVALMLRALDLLGDHVAAARDGGAAPDDAALLAQLAAAQTGVVAEVDAVAPADDDFAFDLDAMLGDIAADISANADWIVTVHPHAGALANGGEPLLLLRELCALGDGRVAIDDSAVPDLDALDPGEGYLRWTVTLPGSVERAAIEEIFDFVGEGCSVSIARTGEEDEEVAAVAVAAPTVAPTPIAAPVAVAVQPVAAPSAPVAEAAAAAPAAGQSIRIDLAKLDRLIDAVGELVIAQAMMTQRLSGHNLGGIEELAMLDGLTRDIQESAMSIRAQPIGSVFSRVPRILRELEASTGKKVRLEVSGEATELDKTVIERLSEPLTHLIRNAVDHGIEPVADRIAAGKSPEGVLSLSAEHRSGRIVIRIADDGRGINRPRVHAKAVERGLIAADAVLSDEEIDNLIFAPGFSTAETLSNISGRGVGMDVVRQNVKELGGRISIESHPGKGSVFTLALPLTLAISDGMIVTVGDQILVVPLAHVVESLRPEARDVQYLGVDRAMLSVRGQFIPILPLEGPVGARGAITDPTQAVLIVVDTEAAGQAALLVDTICDQRQFVIKSLDTHYRPVEGVAGATILGTGRVALIIDVDGLVAGAVSEVAPLKEAA
ncbi:MAG: chemotaxis protein CheA [Sphingomonas sp.]|uniref:chemotaxis protein CheA n=1 Tax=Sphingomonas sp. TaxID=28214 RepID=UPI0025F6BC9F|nr:chemotaxis protein CheA [Sphingomonas sp.]MBY0282363.1 chemotaxis protein CheA [Sphingomonas sp.]